MSNDRNQIGLCDAWRALIERYLDGILSNKKEIPSKLIEGMRYSVLGGGKRLRPLLVLASCRAVNGKAEEAFPFACAVELIHAYSLIHDDLPAMDDDDVRRGKPALHIAIGEGNAILAGDALLTLAFEVVSLANQTADVKIKVVEELSRASGMEGMVGGQFADLASENSDIDIQTLEYIHRHKTGALITASAAIGGLAGGGKDSEIASLRNYGSHIGIAFQIVDDILNVSGNALTMGKSTGSDAERGKATYPSFCGMEKSEELVKENLARALDSIKELGSNAEPLIEIAQMMVNRIN